MAGSNGLDGNVQGRYIGRYDAHPAAPNNLDRWTCYGSATRGVFYSANGTATPVVAGASASTDAYLSEAFEDIAWSVANGYGAIAAYGVAAFFTSIGAGIVVAGQIFANEIAMPATGKIYCGTGTFGNANTPLYIGESGKFSLGDAFKWDKSSLVMKGTLTADSGLVSVAGSLRTVVGTGRVYFYRSNGSSWVLMGSIRSYSATILFSGATDELGCTIGTNGGNINTSGGYIMTGHGNIYTNSGDINTDGGRVFSVIETTSTGGQALVSPEIGESGIILVCEQAGAQYYVYSYARTGDGAYHWDRLFGTNLFYNPISRSGSWITVSALTPGIAITASVIRFT
jgi:hypothetical protein